LSDLSPPSESPTQRRPVSPHFECGLRANGRAGAWIRVCGELDLATAAPFERALQDALSSALLIIIDLRELTFIDGSGLRPIIEAHAQAGRSGRRLVFIRGPAKIDRLFALVGLSDRLQLIDLTPSRGPAPVPIVGNMLDAA